MPEVSPVSPITAERPPLGNIEGLRGLNRTDVLGLSLALTASLNRAGETAGGVKREDEHYDQDIVFLKAKVAEQKRRLNLDKLEKDDDHLWVATQILLPPKEAEIAYQIIRIAEFTALGIKLPVDPSSKNIYKELKEVKNKDLLFQLNDRQIINGPNASLNLLERVLQEKRAEKAGYGRTRRRFFQVAALGTAALAAKLIHNTLQGSNETSYAARIAESSTEIDSAEKLNQYSCLGQFTTNKPEIFMPAGNQLVILNTIPVEVGIKGYSSNFRFAVDIDGQAFEVPVGQLDITKGEPMAEKNIRRNNFLGIRVDDADLIKEAVKLGISKVRIDIEERIFSDNQLTERARKTIQAAKSNNLELVLAFHPTAPLPPQELKRRLTLLFSKEMLGDYNKVAIELGNEPDNKDVKFWKDEDLETFAEFVKQSTDIIWSDFGLKNIPIIIGALTWEGNTEKFINSLETSGLDLANVNPNKLILAVHAYNTVADIEKRMKTTKEILAKKGINLPIWITELGIKADKKNHLVEMLDASKKLGVSAVLIHELPDVEGFGFWDMAMQKPTPYFWLLQYYSQLEPSPLPTQEAKVANTAIPTQTAEPINTQELPTTPAETVKPFSECVLYPDELPYDEVEKWIGNLRNHKSVLTESVFTKELAAMPAEKREEMLKAIASAHVKAITNHYKDTEVIIGLDPGHGGTDSGSTAITKDGILLLEKDLTWQTANMVAEMLYEQTKGKYTVIMLRPKEPHDEDLDKDGFISPIERIQKRKALLLQMENKLRIKSEEEQEIVFLSIHFNGSPDARQIGSETYYPNSSALPNTDLRHSSQSLAQSLHHEIINNIRQAGYPVVDRGAKEDPDNRQPAGNSETTMGPYIVLGSQKLDRILRRK